MDSSYVQMKSKIRNNTPLCLRYNFIYQNRAVAWSAKSYPENKMLNTLNSYVYHREFYC